MASVKMELAHDPPRRLRRGVDVISDYPCPGCNGEKTRGFPLCVKCQDAKDENLIDKMMTRTRTDAKTHPIKSDLEAERDSARRFAKAWKALAKKWRSRALEWDRDTEKLLRQIENREPLDVDEEVRDQARWIAERDALQAENAALKGLNARLRETVEACRAYQEIWADDHFTYEREHCERRMIQAFKSLDNPRADDKGER